VRIARIGWYAAVVAALALLAVLTPARAQSESAVAATAVHHCNIVSTASHRNQGFRFLSSAKANEAHRVCSAVRKSSSVLNYFAHKGRWQVAPRYKRWWQVPGQTWRQVVRRSRALKRWHEHKLAALDRQVQALLPKPQPHLVHDWLFDAFVCIHHGEGAWNTNTGNGYYGGLQMNHDFMQHYGAEYLHQWGTADHWPAWAQIAVSIRAYRSGRGFYPWPQTARNCGLL